MEEDHKRFTHNAKLGIKGEAYFESLVVDYCIPHRVEGARDIGTDYFCHWVNGDCPSPILFAVQVKTRSSSGVRTESLGVKTKWNALPEYRIGGDGLVADQATMALWRGLGLPVYLFLVVVDRLEGFGARINCFYRRYTPTVTGNTDPSTQNFFHVQDERSAFRAYADESKKTGGFARDLFVDYVRVNYHHGVVPTNGGEIVGLNMWTGKAAVFTDLAEEYEDSLVRAQKVIAQTLAWLPKKPLLP